MGKTNQLGVLADVFTSDASNNVGIGGSPSGSYKLEVTGTAKVSSTLLVSGALTGAAATFSGTLTTNGSIQQNSAQYLGSSAYFAANVTNGFRVLNAAESVALLSITNAGDATFTGSATAAAFYIPGANVAGSRNLIAGENTNTGTTGKIRAFLQNSTTSLLIEKYGTGYTSSGIATTAGSAIYDDGAGGLSIGATNGSGTLRLFSGGSEAMRITSGGMFQVGTNSSGAVDWIARFKNATSTGYGVDIQAATDSQSSALLVRSYTGAFDFLSIRGDGVIFTGNASRSPYNDVSAAGANLIVVSGGNLQRSTSSLRFKTNVEDLYTDASSLIYKMRPIWYRSLGYTDRKDWSWYGFIAEEMAEIEPRLVQWGKDENDNDIADGIQYERISVLLVAEMQKMNKLVQELSAQNQDLKSRLDKAGL